MESEPDWYSGTLYGDSKCQLSEEQKKLQHSIIEAVASKASNSSEPIQQSDTLKPFLLDIGNFGLNYAYHKYYCKETNDANEYKHKKTDHPINVIVIGAGMSGLAAAYELAQSGHNVTILESQHRVGGRVKTVGESHFHKGLWADAGAMRLPGTGESDWDGPSHFMTDFYAQKFEVPIIPFVNSNPNGYYKFYGKPAIKMSEWDKDKKGYCSEFWPDWDKNLSEVHKKNPDFDISAYFGETVHPIISELRSCLKTDPNNAWRKWVEKWSQFSVIDLLRSTYEQVLLKFKQSGHYDNADEESLKPLQGLLPWPLEAIVAYTTYTYTISLDVSLVEYLRDELGLWWKDPMHTFKDGMRMLPEAFVKKNKHGWNKEVKLMENIVFGMSAYKIEYTPYFVRVLCRNATTLETRAFEGDKVIITLPINIIRGLTFSPALPPLFFQAIEHINIEPSTKIMVQCRSRFWQSEGIQGGFSKTNLPIGQIHYPSNPEFEVSNDNRGILMCYTWNSEALLFGSQSQQTAIAEVVEELSEIHPEMKKQFEVGMIQSWYDDPNAQGAFAILKPYQYTAIIGLMTKPYQSIYFCGEALSYANGWIQGALESGLRSAYQVFSENEKLFQSQS